MFRKSKADEIGEFFALPLELKGLAVFYLDVSGFIVRNSHHVVLIDPAGMLKDDELNELKGLNLVLFTRNHLDHFSLDRTQDVFKATAAPILAEPKVAEKLTGKIPADKLVPAEHSKTYSIGGVTVTAIRRIHRGPIMLYQLKIGNMTVFHGGDSGS